MRNKAFISATALALCVATTARAEDEKTVTVTGQAAIVNGDQKGATEKARRDAFRLAVEQVGGVQLASSTVVKNFMMTSDVVRSQADGFVKAHEDKEVKCDASVCSVTAAVTVAKSGVDSFYNLMLMQAGHPKVAFVIAERMAGQTDFSLANQERGKSENMLTDYFIERGMKVVDFGGMTGVNLSGAAASGELSAADADKLADKADAQYVVLGKVVGVDAGPIMIQGLRSYNMTFTLKMFSTATHEIVATVTKSNAIPCISPNLAPVSCMSLYRARVVEPAAQELLNKTAKSFQQQVTGERRVQVRAKVASFAALNGFVKALQGGAIGGIKDVQQRTFKDGKATLDLQLEGGDVNYLAGELSSKKVGGSTVEVTGVNNDLIEIEIKK
ncbi:MAG: hypothetical protein HY904_10325 [Deltaproteobacteria bacterium]|nr:hypothetical protein [Deltaproteobacteria bacterium]